MAYIARNKGRVITTRYTRRTWRQHRGNDDAIRVVVIRIRVIEVSVAIVMIWWLRRYNTPALSCCQINQSNGVNPIESSKNWLCPQTCTLRRIPLLLLNAASSICNLWFGTCIFVFIKHASFVTSSQYVNRVWYLMSAVCVCAVVLSYLLLWLWRHEITVLFWRRVVIELIICICLVLIVRHCC